VRSAFVGRCQSVRLKSSHVQPRLALIPVLTIQPARMPRPFFPGSWRRRSAGEGQHPPSRPSASWRVSHNWRLHRERSARVE